MLRGLSKTMQTRLRTLITQFHTGNRADHTAALVQSELRRAAEDGDYLAEVLIDLGATDTWRRETKLVLAEHRITVRQKHKPPQQIPLFYSFLRKTDDGHIVHVQEDWLHMPCLEVLSKCEEMRRFAIRVNDDADGMEAVVRRAHDAGYATAAEHLDAIGSDHD